MLGAVLAFLVLAAQIVVYRRAVSWIAKGAVGSDSLSRRVVILLLLVVGGPVGAYFVARAGSGPNAGFGAATLCFVVGFVFVAQLGNRSEARRNEERRSRYGSTKMPPARAAWVRLSLRDRLQVARLARRGELHPDTLVRAVSLAWAQWVLEYQPKNRRARRIAALDRR